MAKLRPATILQILQKGRYNPFPAGTHFPSTIWLPPLQSLFRLHVHPQLLLLRMTKLKSWIGPLLKSLYLQRLPIVGRRPFNPYRLHFTVIYRPLPRAKPTNFAIQSNLHFTKHLPRKRKTSSNDRIGNVTRTKSPRWAVNLRILLLPRSIDPASFPLNLLLQDSFPHQMLR